MNKKVTKKEIEQINSLTIQYQSSREKLRNLLFSIMNRIKKFEIDYKDIDPDSMLYYYNKYNTEVSCVLIGGEMIGNKLFYYIINIDNIKFDENEEYIIGGKVEKLESYWFDYDGVFNVLETIKNLK